MYRILVADDEGIMLEAFKKCDIQYIWGQLYHRNCQDRKSSDRKKAETFHPDIVFMDIHMPGINGIQAMREIRKIQYDSTFFM